VVPLKTIFEIVDEFSVDIYIVYEDPSVNFNGLTVPSKTIDNKFDSGNILTFDTVWIVVSLNIILNEPFVAIIYKNKVSSTCVSILFFDNWSYESNNELSDNGYVELKHTMNDTISSYNFKNKKFDDINDIENTSNKVYGETVTNTGTNFTNTGTNFTNTGTNTITQTGGTIPSYNIFSAVNNGKVYKLKL